MYFTDRVTYSKDEALDLLVVLEAAEVGLSARADPAAATVGRECGRLLDKLRPEMADRPAASLRGRG